MLCEHALSALSQVNKHTCLHSQSCHSHQQAVLLIITYRHHRVRSSFQVLGATTLMLYAVHLMVHVRKFEPPFVRKPFSVRVVVPCYKEDIETLEETVECAIKAAKIAMDRGQANAGDQHHTLHLLCFVGSTLVRQLSKKDLMQGVIQD
jgi:hypothetical protein